MAIESINHFEMHCWAYSICRSKMYDDNNTKGGKEKWKYILIKFLYFMQNGIIWPAGRL